MTLLRTHYALTSDTLTQFEQTVAPGKRTAVISDLLREWLDQQQRERLRREIVEGCQAMADVYLEIEQRIIRWRRRCRVSSTSTETR